MNKIEGYYVNKVSKERLPELKESIIKKEIQYIKQHIHLSPHQKFLIETQNIEVQWTLYRIASMIILNDEHLKTHGMMIAIPCNKDMLELSGLLAIIVGNEWSIESCYENEKSKNVYIVQNKPNVLNITYDKTNADLALQGSLKQYDTSHAKDLLDHMVGKRNDVHVWIEFLASYTVFDDVTDIETLARMVKEDIVIWGKDFNVFYTLRKYMVLRKGLDIRKLGGLSAVEGAHNERSF